jgi:predicted ATPase
LFQGLFGQFLVYLSRGTMRAAYPLAQQLMRQAESSEQPVPLMYARWALGATSFWAGELLSAREHVEAALSLYNPERDRQLAFNYTVFDARVWCLVYLVLIQWLLGYPDRAIRLANELLVSAQGLAHLLIAGAQYTFGTARMLVGDLPAAQTSAERAIALASEHGLAAPMAMATFLRGYAIAKRGRAEEGIAQMREGVAGVRDATESNSYPFLCLLAEICIESNRLGEAHSALVEARAFADLNGIRNFEEEAHRLMGELLLRQSDSNFRQAQGCFEQAIEVARKQSTKSWELRATTSLARLLAKQGHRTEARTMLAEIYNWFTEGFDTTDLKEAKGLLDKLSGPIP